MMDWTIIGGFVVLASIAATIGAYLRPKRGKGISILIPFRCLHKEHARTRNVEWLKKYWKKQLPGAEIIIGEDPCVRLPFSKSVAVNDAVSKSSGDVLVIIDADGYMSPKSVLRCAEEIRSHRERGHRLWFVPYRQFYRLTQAASELLLASDPSHPLLFSEPLDPVFTINSYDDAKVGHWYGAMCQIMPREAFDLVGGWDERFRGWGGEDHAAMRAMDTLYCPHKTLPGMVCHIWHPQLGPQGEANSVHWKERMWDGQEETCANDVLSMRYYGAYRKPERMRKLLDEWHEWREHQPPCQHHHEHEDHEHHHHEHHEHHHHKHHHHRPSC